MAQFTAGYTFPVLNSDGTYSSTKNDFDDVFVKKDYFENGGLYTWGYNQSGSLGLGNILHISSPSQVGSLSTWKLVASAPYSKFAIKTDGTLWSWGRNYDGQLGQSVGYPILVARSSPVQVGLLTNWKLVISGNYANGSSNPVYAFKTDGTLWTWGYAEYFLGTGSISGGGVSSPIQIGLANDWKVVTVNGHVRMFGIKPDNSLWGWGRGGYGNALGLPNPNTTVFSSPVQIGSLTNWKYVAGGKYHTIGLKTDGTIWSWGCCNNTYPEFLGRGNLVDGHSSPVQIGSLTDWKVIACGVYDSAAIKTDGTLWGWGANWSGELGLSTNLSISSPVQVGSLSNWKSVVMGYDNMISLKTDGTIWGTGSSLDNGYYSVLSSPVQIGKNTNWKQISIGEWGVAGITSN